MVDNLRVVTWAVAAALLAGSAARAQTASGLQPFQDFVAGLRAAQAEPYLAPKQAIARAADFNEMRAHLLRLYDGVRVRHSYALDSQVFDCVPIAQQPSLRLSGETAPAAPPPVPPGGSPSEGAPDLPPNSFDAYGNAQACADGEIPMRRVTLDEMSRFKNLRDFFKKEPQSDAATETHKYAYELDYRNNYGGYSVMSLWKPVINTALTEVFSLSQHWYTAGSGSTTQTAEVGWQNFPQKYGVNKPVQFVYWTADDYVDTGCYNLDCPGFVQTSSKLHLGAGYSAYSVAGGTLREIGMGYYFYKGNWWMSLGGEFTWVGYIKGTSYSGGGMSNHSTLSEWGGEVVGATRWPPMGSGKFAAAGLHEAAYHRSIMWRSSGDKLSNVKLTPEDPAPKCYSTKTFDEPNWGRYFFFGGPGGSDC